MKLFELAVFETSLKTLDLNSDIAGVKAFVYRRDLNAERSGLGVAAIQVALF